MPVAYQASVKGITRPDAQQDNQWHAWRKKTRLECSLNVLYGTPMTPRQQTTLTFARDFVRDHSHAPSLDETSG